MSLLRDRSTEFDEAGVALYGISRDSPYTHVAWTQVLDLTFPLISDWNGEATEGFRLAFEYRGLRGVSRRSAFLVGTDGSVRGAWSYGTGEVPDVDELLAAGRALRA
ncbi:MAG: redoxin domain-containing protein [Thermoleophilia bacterium]|nr:redoxin domain-containing protein [Thermoleophilia bacterium]